MYKTAKINDMLIEDALALENLFRSAGLETHARAIRIALENAKDDVIQEQNYGTDTIYKGLESAVNIHRSVSANLSEKLTNKNIVDILNNHISDIDNIKDIEKAPKFVRANNLPILQVLSSLIEHIKPQDPDQIIDKNTTLLLKQLQHFTGGV